jgi:ER-bound oxygenase mpaB/B'/Rubber oxygenase, catalytic domain
VRQVRALFRSWALDEIQRLDPVRDHLRIVLLSTRVDFPFDTTRALELALFRTFGVPSISALLHRTGEFERRAQKRYDDTDLILSELTEHGYDSERGRAALARMNEIHGRFRIANEDFLYVLSTFVFEPIRFNARFGWRPMGEAEKLALFHFWRAVGARMGIRDIPEDYATFERYNLDYERRYYRFTEENRAVGIATRELFAGWFPRPLRPLIRQAIYALLDGPTRVAFGFPEAHPLFRRLVPAALRARAVVLRLFPRRRRPSLRTAMQHPSYPDGYEIARLGP